MLRPKFAGSGRNELRPGSQPQSLGRNFPRPGFPQAEHLRPQFSRPECLSWNSQAEIVGGRNPQAEIPGGRNSQAGINSSLGLRLEFPGRNLPRPKFAQAEIRSGRNPQAEINSGLGLRRAEACSANSGLVLRPKFGQEDGGWSTRPPPVVVLTASYPRG